MDIKNLQNKKVAILGFGQEGQAVTHYLIKHGIKPVLFDEKPLNKWPSADKKIVNNLKLKHVLGKNSFKNLLGFDVVFRSPGIPLSHKGLQSRIKDKGLRIIISSQTKWFFEHCPAKIIGVTGTKGKGTTASLIYKILKKNFQISNFPPRADLYDKFQIKSKNQNPKTKVYLTGNIGKGQPLDFLDKLKPNDWVVYELSSFQLQDLNISPHIGVVLMITQEHLDYHKNISEYFNAKEAIVKYQMKNDIAIINADFSASAKIGELSKGKKIYFSRRKILKQGCFIKNNNVVLSGFGKIGAKLKFPISKLQLRGEHNLENVCAAAAAAYAANCSLISIKKCLKTFKGLEHRLEFITEKKGIKYYNDSFSTTPETAIAAINAFKEPLILILGGSSKKSDFTKLGQTVAKTKNIKSVILIGKEAGKIKSSILKYKSYKRKFFQGAKSMKDIFFQIKKTASRGDVVLLSPACASFDMFKNYRDRGEQFKKFAIKNG